MEIYLVRHGQTDGNLQRRHQMIKSTLTTLGKAQAKEVGRELKKIHPTHLVSSSLIRAIETARIIGDECGLTTEISSLFEEVVRPQGMYGRHHFSPTSLWFYLRWYLGSEEASERKGESYKEFRERFSKAQEYLSKLPADARVVVVSHGVFITFFLIHMCNKKWLNPLQALRVYKDILSLPNGSVTKISYDPVAPANTCAWRVES